MYIFSPLKIIQHENNKYNGWFVNITLVWTNRTLFTQYLHCDSGVAKKLSDPLQNKQTYPFPVTNTTALQFLFKP